MARSIRYLIKKTSNNLLKNRNARRVKKYVTLSGTAQTIGPRAMVCLYDGATKENVVLHEHCELFGVINCHADGKVIMHPWSKIGTGAKINAVNRVEIGKDTAIATGVEIIDNNNHPINPDDRRYMRHTPHGSRERLPRYSANAPIVIGENVWVGSYSRIQKGVTIGDNAIIASHSVVTHDVPANAIAAGNPAKIVKTDIDKKTTPIFPLNNN